MRRILAALLLAAPAFGAMPTYVSNSGAVSTGGTSVVIPAPAGIANNDILVAAIIATPDTATVTPPSGFSLLAEDIVVGQYRFGVYWKRAASESGNYTFSFTGGGTNVGAITLYRGAKTSGTPFNATGSFSSGVSTSPQASSITPTAKGSLLLFLGFNFSGDTWTAPAGMTEVYDNFIVTDTQELSSATATGTRTATMSASNYWSSVLVALTPSDISYFGSASNPADSSTATGATSTVAVTPPSSMIAGDLVFFTAFTRSNSAVSMAISQASGQTWNTLAATANTSITAQTFWARFNGTWGASPSIAVTGTSPYSAVMHVFRPTVASYTWAVDQAQQVGTFTAGTTPFTKTITGQTSTQASTVTLAGWFSPDDNTWGNLSGTGWAVAGSAQYRNTSGSDQSGAFAYKVQTSAGATGNVSLDQLTLGGDAGASMIVTMYEVTGDYTRSISDSLSPSDSISRTITRSRSTSDTLSQSDAIAAVRGAPRAAADSLSPSDSTARSIARLGNAGDTLSLSDSPSGVINRLRSASDSLSASDSTARVRAAALASSETLSASDSTVRLVARLASTADSLTNTDSTARVAGRNATISDSLTFTESADGNIASGSTDLPRSISDSLSLSESPTWLRSVSVTLSESLTTSDTTARIRAALGTATDSFTVSDSTSRHLALLASATTSLSFLDSADRLRGMSSGVSDTNSISDAAGIVLEHFSQDVQRGISDSLMISDSLGVTRWNLRKSFSFVQPSRVMTATPGIREFGYTPLTRSFTGLQPTRSFTPLSFPRLFEYSEVQ